MQCRQGAAEPPNDPNPHPEYLGSRAMPHRRRYSRLPFQSASTLTVGDARESCATELIDISLKGALVADPDDVKVPLGSQVLLRVRLADSDVEIHMHTEVAHHEEGRLGLHCVAIDMDSMIHLRRLMELNLGDPGLLERELLALG